MSTADQRARFGIQELVQLSGVPRRTVRYYVQIGLLAAPEGAGRGHYYLPAHLERLVRIRDLRQQGRSLDEIRALLDRRGGGPAAAATPPMELATRIRLRSGIELVVPHGAEPPTPTQLRDLAAAAARILSRA
jgi:DNA-binding transcriptional MerR regulator